MMLKLVCGSVGLMLLLWSCAGAAHDPYKETEWRQARAKDGVVEPYGPSGSSGAGKQQSVLDPFAGVVEGIAQQHMTINSVNHSCSIKEPVMENQILTIGESDCVIEDSIKGEDSIQDGGILEEGAM